jgi:hypothetical protein
MPPLATGIPITLAFLHGTLQSFSYPVNPHTQSLPTSSRLKQRLDDPAVPFPMAIEFISDRKRTACRLNS